MPNNRNLERFLKPDVKLSENGFPLEQRDVFSTKAGLLNVAKVISVIPNDYFEISPTVFVETDRFNNVNFTRMSQHLDLFYVPISSIQTRWNEWYQQTVDPQNAIFDLHPIMGQAADNFVPSFHLASIVFYLCFAKSMDIFLNNQDLYNEFNHKLQDYDSESSVINYAASIGLGYLREVNIDNYNILTQYYKLFMGRSGALETLAEDKLGYPLYLNTIRLLDMCGYGNYLPIINLPLFSFNADAIIETCKATMLPPRTIISQLKTTFEQFLSSIDKSVNVYALASYQAVCHNYFTNPHFERPSVISYNFDDLDMSDVVVWRLLNDNYDKVDNIRGLFTMNYTPWKKDIFLSALPSPQFGDVSVVTVLSDVVKRTNGLNPTQNSAINTNIYGEVFAGSVSTPSNRANLVGNFSTIDLVRANALQYWKQQIGRSGYRTNDRFRATFGDVPRHDGRIIPIPIGSVSNQINKDSVVGSSGSDFGERRSLGSSLINNNTIKFRSFNEFGFIVAIYRILPESDYDAYGIDKHHTKFDPFDFFTAAFQNLGLEALDGSEISVYREDSLADSPVVGYVPRYHEYKTAVDKIHGEFCNMPLSLLRPESGLVTPTVGAFSSLVSSRIDLESYVGSVRQFYVDPAVLDNLFVINADGDQNTDQFWITSYLDIKAIRSMSVLGLPQF